MTIYIDSDYKCHTAPGEGLTASVKKHRRWPAHGDREN